MKLQLDTTAKTVKVEGTVNLNDLFETLKKLLPQGEWKDFTLETNVTIVWSNPITIQPWTYPIPITTPYYPWWTSPVITCSTAQGDSGGNVQYALNEGVYNIQV